MTEAKVFTEDDTFRALSRPSFQEMTRLYRHHLGGMGVPIDSFFEQYGWTFDEYLNIKWDHDDNDWKRSTI